MPADTAPVLDSIPIDSSQEEMYKHAFGPTTPGHAGQSAGKRAAPMTPPMMAFPPSPEMVSVLPPLPSPALPVPPPEVPPPVPPPAVVPAPPHAATRQLQVHISEVSIASSKNDESESKLPPVERPPFVEEVRAEVENLKPPLIGDIRDACTADDEPQTESAAAGKAKGKGKGKAKAKGKCKAHAKAKAKGKAAAKAAVAAPAPVAAAPPAHAKAKAKGKAAAKTAAAAPAPVAAAAAAPPAHAEAKAKGQANEWGWMKGDAPTGASWHARHAGFLGVIPEAAHPPPDYAGGEWSYTLKSGNAKIEVLVRNKAFKIQGMAEGMGEITADIKGQQSFGKGGAADKWAFVTSKSGFV